MAKKKQPMSIVVSCLVLVIAGLVMLVVGGTNMTAVSTTATGGTTTPITDPTGLMAYMPVAPMFTAMSAVILVLGLVFLLLSYLLWVHNELAWYGTTVFVGLSFVISLVQYFMNPALGTVQFFVSLVLAIVVILLMFHKSTIRAINPDIKYNGWAI